MPTAICKSLNYYPWPIFIFCIIDCACWDSEYQITDRSTFERVGRTIFNRSIGLRHVIGGIFYGVDCGAYQEIIFFDAYKVTLLLINIPYRTGEISDRLDVVIEARSARNSQDHCHNTHWFGPKKVLAASL
jgi:hypothetical protein